MGSSNNRLLNLIVKTVILLLLPLQLISQNSVQRYVKKLQKEPNFISSTTAILVEDSKGKRVAWWNPDMQLNTASTIKTITTGVALELLGSQYKFVTTIKYSGLVVDSVLQGDIFIVGGADPTLGSTNSIATPIEQIFKEWKEAIENVGIKRVEGKIVADNSYLSQPYVLRGRSWAQLGVSYGAAVNGLSFAENSQKLKLTPGENLGDSIIIEQLYPYIPEMQYKNEATTGKSGVKYSRFYYTSPLAKIGLLRGKVPSGVSHLTMSVSNLYPHLSAAYHFAQYLNSNGIAITDRVTEVELLPPFAKDGLTTIAKTYSPPLYQIVEVTNRVSHNFYAETIFRVLGRELGKLDSYSGAAATYKRELEKIGVSTKGYLQNDGSGLSRANLVSPQFFCNYFREMEKSAIFPRLFNSLPIPGESGTLSKVLEGYPQSVKRRIHAKSGTLADARCYAGYVEREKGGFLYFAILTNNLSVPISKIQPYIEGFLYELTKY